MKLYTRMNCVFGLINIAKRYWVILAMLLTACHAIKRSETPVDLPQTASPAPAVTATMPPLPTFTPPPVIPTPTFTQSPVPSAPYPEEWLAFVVRDFRQFHPTIYELINPQTAILFVNSNRSEVLQPELLDLNQARIERSLAWSADGQYLLFDGSSTLELRVQPIIYLADLLKRTTTTITSKFEYSSFYLGSPSWAPNGHQLVTALETTVANSGGIEQRAYNLIKLHALTLESERLTISQSSDLHPSWSPDGQWIAFIRYIPPSSCPPSFPTNYLACNKAGLFLVRPDGSDPTLLRQPIYVQSDQDGRDFVYNSPSWSPDSRWLAVLVGDEQPDIALVNVESGETQRLAAHPAQDLYPTWSPDGSHLAFVSDRDGNEEIYLVSADGSELINLTRDLGSDFNPVWSPSGRFIAFLSDREEPGAYKLYLMNADGTNQRKLHDGYVFTRPAWFPLIDVDLRNFIGLEND